MPRGTGCTLAASPVGRISRRRLSRSWQTACAGAPVAHTWFLVSCHPSVHPESTPSPKERNTDQSPASPGLVQPTLVVYAYAVGSYFDFQMNYYMSSPYGINPATLQDSFAAAGSVASSNVAATVL